MSIERQPGQETAPNDTHEEVLPGERQLGDGDPQAEQQYDPAHPAPNRHADQQLR